MAARKKHVGSNPGFVPQAVCDERFQRVLDAVDSTRKQAEETNGHIIRKIDELKADVKDMKEKAEKEKTEASHALRNLILTIAAGAITAAIGYAFSHIH